MGLTYVKTHFFPILQNLNIHSFFFTQENLTPRSKSHRRKKKYFFIANSPDLHRVSYLSLKKNIFDRDFLFFDFPFWSLELNFIRPWSDYGLGLAYFRGAEMYMWIKILGEKLVAKKYSYMIIKHIKTGRTSGLHQKLGRLVFVSLPMEILFVSLVLCVYADLQIFGRFVYLDR